MSNRAVHTPFMENQRMNYIGKVAKVRSAFDGGQLPDGLPEGSRVRMVGFDIGRFDVEHGGRTFRIAMACVQNLHQLWN